MQEINNMRQGFKATLMGLQPQSKEVEAVLKAFAQILHFTEAEMKEVDEERRKKKKGWFGKKAKNWKIN